MRAILTCYPGAFGGALSSKAKANPGRYSSSYQILLIRVGGSGFVEVGLERVGWVFSGPNGLQTCVGWHCEWRLAMLSCASEAYDRVGKTWKKLS